MELPKFADRMKFVRAQTSEEQGKALSQQDFADFVGTTQKNISKYEAGRLPEAKIIISMCRKLNLNIHWLLTGVGAMGQPHLTPEQKDQLIHKLMEENKDLKKQLDGVVKAMIRKPKNGKTAGQTKGNVLELVRQK